SGSSAASDVYKRQRVLNVPPSAPAPAPLVLTPLSPAPAEPPLTPRPSAPLPTDPDAPMTLNRN
ncbi:hypothetical protein OUA97_21490, partial [Phenylobacterium sp. 58.2.17]|nr:hypothetical protein [Phenylobacterium sp. 58.2.17]